MDMLDNKENRSTDDVAKSYLAIPFFSSPSNQSILTLYAESYSLNIFADDERGDRPLIAASRFARLSATPTFSSRVKGIPCGYPGLRAITSTAFYSVLSD
jgi:hypothetical protein